MATNGLQHIAHHHHHHHHRCSLIIKHRHLHSQLQDTTPPPRLKSITTKTTCCYCLSSSFSSSSSAVVARTFALSPNATSAASASTASSSSCLDALRGHLEAGDFREADEETRRLLIALAGEAAQKRGYVFFSEVQYIPEAELRAIDELWRGFSGGRFGYSVQKKIFAGKAGGDFTRFFIKVGWMKKLDTEVEQYNYRSFPAEFMWQLDGDTPEGHLPLTNALRGTQLLNSIFNHPAFDDVDEEPEPSEPVAAPKGSSNSGNNNTVFKPDYRF